MRIVRATAIGTKTRRRTGSFGIIEFPKDAIPDAAHRPGTAVLYVKPTLCPLIGWSVAPCLAICESPAEG
jgi:hypothetical protein